MPSNGLNCFGFANLGEGGGNGWTMGSDGPKMTSGRAAIGNSMNSSSGCYPPWPLHLHAPYFPPQT